MQGTIGDHKLAIEDYFASQAGVSSYENYIKLINNYSWSAVDKQYRTQERAIENSYNVAEQELAKEAQKNISSAYSNYIASQMQLKHSRDLTEGYKGAMNKSVENAYQSSMYDINQALDKSITDIETKEASDLAALESKRQSDYATMLANTEKSISEKFTNLAESFTKYNRYLFEYSSELLDEDYNNLFALGNDGKRLGWSDELYNILYETTDNGTLELSDDGKVFLETLMGNESGFEQWLQGQLSAEEYSDYVTNQGVYNQVLFGEPTRSQGVVDSEENRLAQLMSTSQKITGKYWEEQNIGVSNKYDGTTLDVDNTFKDEFDIKKAGNVNSSYGFNNSLMKAGDGNTLIQQFITEAYYNKPEDVKVVRQNGNNVDVKLKPGSETAKQFEKIKQTLEVLEANYDPKKGDIYSLDNGYLAYYTGNKFRLVKNDDASRTALANSGVKGI